MTYLVPSFFQKRILRYALSRLELLDTDALDLEKLDIAWGRRSIIELRDIPVNTKKLATLLQLPPSLGIISAQVLYLRLTVPADLYQSGIVVEAQGVEVRVHADLEEQAREEKNGHKGHRSHHKNRATNVKAGRPRNTQSHVHDPGGPRSRHHSGPGFDDDEGFSERLPTIDDLAKSFLQSEPKDKKAELEAAITQSQDLDQSQVSSEEGDEPSDLGVGYAISLPGFLADFLKGVGERVQLRVQDVTLDLSLKVDLSSDSSASSDASDRSELVTMRLSVDDIALEGVVEAQVTGSQDDSLGDASTDARDVRRITFHNIQAMLISEASLFANLARSTGPSSSETTPANTLTKSGSKTTKPTSSSTETLSHSAAHIATPWTKNQRGLESSSANDHNRSIMDPIGGTEDRSLTTSADRYPLRASKNRESAFTDSFYSGHGSSQLMPKSIVDWEASSLSPSYPGSANHSLSVSRDQRNITPTHCEDSLPETFKVRTHQTQPTDSNDVDRQKRLYTEEASDDLPHFRLPSESNSSSPASGGASPSEDLTQSKLFSHEEAESMYMSAISHASIHKDKSNSIPGNWEPSDSEGEDEAKIASFFVDPLITQDCSSSSSRHRFYGRGLGLENDSEELASEHDKIAGASTQHVSASPSKSTMGTQPEAKSYTQPIDQGNTSSQGSEASSANLRSAFSIEKRIMSIDIIVLELPIVAHRVDSPTGTSTPQPTARKQRQNGSSQLPHISIVESPGIASGPGDTNDNQHSGQPSIINMGGLQVFGDVGLTRMTILMVQHLNAMHAQPPSDNTRRDVPKPLSIGKHHFVLKIKTACWKFLDAVKGVRVASPHSEAPEAPADTYTGDSEVLLRADIENLHGVLDGSKASTKLQLSMGRLRFGYASDEILSFDSGLKMRQSTRDILAPIDNDIVLTVKSLSDTTKIDITTLPVHLKLDLRRLDETFGWFGGFSSMLDLGSSAMSTVTVKEAVWKTSHTSKAFRGVHFESQKAIRPVHSRPHEAENKISVRIGGLAFDLRGSQTSLHLETSAMKLVSRVEGLGMAVDRLNFSGPQLQHAGSEPSIGMKISNLRVEYLSTPKENDLDRLLALLFPSKDKYERDDDILLDTLLRQRRQGGVIRATVESLDGRISNTEDLHCFPALLEDLKKLSTVAKYLPEDDRPGVLTLALVRDLKFETTIDGEFGVASLMSQNIEIAHVSLPSLMAVGITNLSVHRNHVEELIGKTMPMESGEESCLPMIMARFIGNEMEPIAKIKLHNVRIEYHVSAVMAIMGYTDTTDDRALVADMVNSIATLTSRDPVEESPPRLSNQVSPSSNPTLSSKAMGFDIDVRDSIIGLNPRSSPAKGLVVLTDTHLVGVMPKKAEANATLEIRKASIMVIDDFSNVNQASVTSIGPSLDSRRSQVEALSANGYVSVSTISAAEATVQIVKSEGNTSKAIDIELRDKLFVLESCADSTQTLLAVIGGLNPPSPPNKEAKYQTEVVPVEDMLASFTGDAFIAGTGDNKHDDDLPLGLDEGDMVDDEVPQNLEFVSSFYNPSPEATNEGIADNMLEDNLESLVSPSMIREIGDKNVLESFEEQAQVAPGNMPLEFHEDHFGSTSNVAGTAHRCKSKYSTSEWSSDVKLGTSPLKVRVRDVHIIWNLFDGYDWQHTRDVISHAVEDVQNKAAERLSRKDKRKSIDPEEEEESVIGDFLFNSIYIGIPANRDPNELARQVNYNLDDLASETGSYSTSSTPASPSRQGQAQRAKTHRLRLKRSRHHKMTFELTGVSADVVVFPPGSGETQSSIDVRVQDLDIFDHVPTSTWKKFATYMHDAGEREIGTSMIHLEILNVKPLPNLAASEIMLKAAILPLRLHVDQDALDFMTRFFEFKDDSTPAQISKSEPVFIQRAEVNSVRIKLDFKPKRVDYAGIRSGHTNEFMNFFILQESDMVLRRVIIYGVSGFDKLGKTLNNIWMPDVKHNQLPGVLAGLAPFRSLVNVGGGFRDLIVIPIREYQKDGRVIRSFRTGATVFAKTTTSELVKLGAKLAMGTQSVLQGAENLLNPPPPARADISSGWEDGDIDEEEKKKKISLYADQPLGLVQGLRGGYASLERDLLTARDAIVAMPGEILDSRTAGGAARAVLRNAPTIILRPAMGVSKAVGQTLMGATNSLDPGNRRRVEDKYKKG